VARASPKRAPAAPALALWPGEAPRRLHLGCGSKHIPGFFHIDLAPAPHVDLVAPVERLGFSQNHPLVFDVVSKDVPGLNPQPLSNFLGHRDLILG